MCELYAGGLLTRSYLCRTDPKDVARVESKTWIVTKDKYETVTHTPPGVEPEMGHWMPQEQFGRELDDRFPGCMAGKSGLRSSSAHNNLQVV